ncbi:MAG: hypothetical protein V4632_23780 [Pseudomonadota bacterium]
MKKHLTLEIDDIGVFINSVCTGLNGYATEFQNAGRLNSLWLFCCNGTSLRFQATVTTVAPRYEVGTLVVKTSFQRNTQLIVSPLPLVWGNIKAIERLIIENAEFLAESGLSIQNIFDEEITILPGAFPHTVELLAPFYPHNFEPEYNVAEYKRKAIYTR